MTQIKAILDRAGTVLRTARDLAAARLPAFRGAAAGGVCRAATAGAILFAFAGAGLGARGGFSTFRVDSAAAGATVSVGWGYGWLAWAFAGATAGALAGTLAALAARKWLRPERAPAGVLAVGLLGGVLAGATWGGAVARERVVEVRAQQTSAAPLPATRGAAVTVVNGPIRLSGAVSREMNLPLLAFMLLGGTVVGALVARGLPESLPFMRGDEGKPTLDDLGRPRHAPTRPTGAFPLA